MQFLTPDEVGKILNVTSRTIRKLGESSVLPGAVKIGKQWRFRKDLIMNWLAKQTEPETLEDAGKTSKVVVSHDS